MQTQTTASPKSCHSLDWDHEGSQENLQNLRIEREDKIKPNKTFPQNINPIMGGPIIIRNAIYVEYAPNYIRAEFCRDMQEYENGPCSIFHQKWTEDWYEDIGYNKCPDSLMKL